MEKQNGNIVEYGDGYSINNMLFTYSEEEMQEHKDNKVIAEGMYRPEFIKLDYNMLHSGYSRVETALYGFMQFFLINNDKFFISNQKLAEMLNVGETTISNAISKLKDDGLIELTYKIKEGGGKKRYIKLGLTKIKSMTYKICKSDIQNLYNIKNNTIKNKYIENNSSLSKFETFWNKYPIHKQKKTAYEKFIKLSSEKQDLAISGIDKQMQSKNWKEGYIPYPTTYINQERREDEDTEQKKNNDDIERYRKRIREKAKENDLLYNNKQNEDDKAFDRRQYC